MHLNFKVQPVNQGRDAPEYIAVTVDSRTSLCWHDMQKLFANYPKAAFISFVHDKGVVPFLTVPRLAFAGELAEHG